MGSCTSQKVLMKHKQRCEQKEIMSIGTSNESHLNLKKHFDKNPFNFRIYSDF